MRRFLLSALICAAVSPVFAENDFGRVGLHYTVGPAFALGGAGAQSVGKVGPGVGAGLTFGLMRDVQAEMTYDYLDPGVRAEALTFGATARFPYVKEVTPVFGFGLGIGRRYSGDGMDHFTMRLEGGLERPLNDNLSMTALLRYFFIPGSDDHGIGDVHVMEPGLRVNFKF